AVPVVARTVQVERRPAFRMVHQPYEFSVAIARQERTVRVFVIVYDRQLDVAAVRHDQNGGIPAEFVLLDPDRRLHRAVGPLSGFSYGASTQNAAKGRVVLFVQAELTQ